MILDVPAERQILAALRARRNRLREVIEAREALEVKLAALAARRCTLEDLEAIDDALALMAREIAQGERGVGETSTSTPLSPRRRTPGCSPA
ncbi:FCD domain-containing protein [Pseudonocardia sp. T1-2H]|uniref:FCD domain-containing protein n=1 Tax=Pseudonocardia sp. T1-2H TaxID=3128899 RepID=UPI0031016AA5